MIRLLARRLLALCCVLTALWLAAPTLIIVPISFAEKQSLAFPPTGFSTEWYRAIVTNPVWSESLILSFEIALIVAVTATLLGTLAALGMERLKKKSAGIMRLLLITPMIVPGVVLAVGIYAVYLDARLVGTWSGYILAHTLLALPFVIIAVGASLSVFDARLQLAASSLGASPVNVFITVTMPLIAPGIFSGMAFAFATSFDEVIVSLFIASPQLKTLPVQIFASMTRDSDPTIAALGVLTFSATTLVIGLGLLAASAKERRS